MVAKRRQIIAVRKALGCQAKQASHPLIRAQNDELLALIEAQIATLMAVIEALIAVCTTLARNRKLLRSIPGIGEVSALTLLADMPELGSLRPGAAASLAGLAPFSRDSGTLSGVRYIQGGRGVIRDVLYMAAISASGHQASLKPFADRLKARHKPGKQILIAVARKLVETANAVLARQSEWVAR